MSVINVNTYEAVKKRYVQSVTDFALGFLLGTILGIVLALNI